MPDDATDQKLWANADAAELAKFDRLAEQWWDPEGDFKPLHQLNPVRSAYIAQYADLDQCRLLDVGCGGGILSESMAQAGAQVTAIDLAEKPLEVARNHRDLQALNIDYRRMSAEQLAADVEAGDEAPFEVITCLEMLEHVPEPDDIIAAIAAMLTPGGICVLSTLNRTPKAFLLGIVAAEYLLGLLARGTHTYRDFIKPSELDRSGRRHGLERLGLTGIHYDPFSGKAELDGDVSINYMACYRKR